MIKRPVSLLLTTRELDQGGIERDVTKLALGVDRARFTPHVATYSARGMRYEELREAAVPVFEVPVGSLASASTPRIAGDLWRYLRRNKIRLVHSYDASGIFVLPVARAARVPVALTAQLSYRDILDARTQQLLRWTDRFTDGVTVNCEAIRNYMINDEHLPAGRVDLCYNGVDSSIFYPAAERKPAEVADASLVIGTLCALRAEKALPLLQEAFARIASEYSGAKLLMVGSGVELARLRKNADQLGIGEHSVWIPATSEVAKWMRAIDIFVLPSYSEAFSNSLLEAMACGCCVVGSRVGGTPELIGEDERGLLFESGNATALADKLLRLAGNPDLRTDLGRRAARWARETLSVARAVDCASAIWDRRLALKGL